MTGNACRLGEFRGVNVNLQGCIRGIYLAVQILIVNDYLGVILGRKSIDRPQLRMDCRVKRY